MWDLDPSVAAAYGLPPSDPTMPSDPSVPDFGIHPAVAAAYGWAPPAVSALPSPPPPDPQGEGGAGERIPGALPPPLPSMGTPAQSPASGAGTPAAPGRGDYHVPASAFGQQSAPTTVAPTKPAAPGKPVSPQQLEVDAHARQDAADRQAAGAIGAQQDVATAAAQQNLADFSKHAEAAKQIEDQRKALADDIAKTHAQKQAYVDQTMREVDDYKVDHDKFVHDMGVGDRVGWAIATALSAVGQAMQHQSGPNPVVQMLQERMHQAVVAQMDQREQLKEKNTRAEHSLDKFDAFSKDRQAQMDMLDARNDRWLAQQVALTGAKMADPAARASAQQQYAALMESSADKATKAADKAVEHDIQYKHVALAQSANAIAGGHLALAQQAERRAQKLQDMEWGPGGFKEQELGLKAAEEQRKILKDQQQKIKDEGLGNPTTGDPLLTERGRAMMTQADQLEAAARKDPAHAAAAYVQHLREQATTPQGKAQVDQIEAHIKSDPATAQQVAQGYITQLRQTANTTEVATIADPVARREVQDGIKWGQDLINTTAKIKDFLIKDPDITDRAGWGRLQSEYGTAMVQYARAIGARASSRELDAISKHIMTYDPNSLIDRTFRKAPGAAALDGLQDAVKGGVDSLLKSHRIKDGWTPSSPLEHPALTFGGKTAMEIGEEAKPGLLSRARAAVVEDAYALTHPTAKDVYSPPDPQDTAADAARGRTATFGKAIQTSDYGLDPVDERNVHVAIVQAESASDAKRKQIIDSLAAPIVANDRPSLAWGLLHMVHDQDPAMFEYILKEVGTERAKEIRRFMPASPIVPTPPALPYKPSGFDPDAAARGSKGD